MSYVLHGAPGTGSGIIELCLTRMGAPFEIQDLDARNHEHHGESYSALNPNQKMPTLQTPEGETLTESAAIVLALDERHPQSKLLPHDPTTRARALRWMIFFVSELYPLVEIMDYPKRFAPEDPDPLKARATARWMERWTMVEAALQAEPWALGSDLSALDFYVSVFGRWIEDPAWREAELPKTERIRSELRARAEFASTVKRHHL